MMRFEPLVLGGKTRCGEAKACAHPSRFHSHYMTKKTMEGLGVCCSIEKSYECVGTAARACGKETSYKLLLEKRTAVRFAPHQTLDGSVTLSVYRAISDANTIHLTNAKPASVESERLKLEDLAGVDSL